jgi:hypothetical protein
MKRLFVVLIAALLISCSSEQTILEQTQVKPSKKVLVIGNSITKSPPGGEWLGNWGMAASAPEKDFCSLLEKGMDAELLDRKNIAIWENNFNCSEEHYSITTSLQYDYIIVKIGENVSDLINFKVELQKLIDYYEQYGNKIVLVTTVWGQYEFDVDGNPYGVPSEKDKAIKEVALENSHIFVDISEIQNDPIYYALGQFNDAGVAAHPSDLGMEFIANKILSKL